MRVAAITWLLFREYQRNSLLLTLLVIVPFVFITLSFYITEDIPMPILVRDGGEIVTMRPSMPDLHGAIMVPITAAFLAGLVGLFTMIGAARNDVRLVIAGASSIVVTGARLALILILSAVVTLIAVGVTLLNFRPEAYAGFLAGNLLVGLSYALIGVIAALLVGRLGGAYLMFTLPMIDIGIYQDPMLISGTQPLWMKLLPGYGGTRLVLDAGFTNGFDEWTALAAAIAWVLVLGTGAAYLFSATRSG